MRDKFEKIKIRGRELYSVARTPFVIYSALSRETASEVAEYMSESEFRIEDPEIDIREDNFDLEIANNIGLEVPEETVKLVYGSGKQMRTDFLGFSEEDIVEALSQNFDFPLEGPARTFLAAATANTAVNSLREANAMMGVNQMKLDPDLKLENRTQFAICPNNIEGAYPDSQEEAERYTEIHETVHAAQMQNYQIEEKLEDRQRLAIEEENTDPVVFLMTTLEGHATYFGDKIASEEYDIELDEAAKSMLADTSEEKEDQYIEGEEFIKSLYEAGGIRLANHALRKPPETRREIEDPEIWYENKADLDVLKTYWDIEPENIAF